ncbi:MAG: hypothetical protein U5J64_00530 [Halobacteriales archaeon]|nr:hypothetical protein [Halobacteriales archaeon]
MERNQAILYAFALVYALIGAAYVYALSVDSRSLMNVIFALLMAFTGLALYVVPRLEDGES